MRTIVLPSRALRPAQLIASARKRRATKFKQPKLTYAMPDDPPLRTAFIRSVERLGGVGKLERVYGRVLAQYEDNGNFWQAALEQLQVRLDYDARQLDNIPHDKPVILIANHPFGLLDGLAICHLATLARGDFRILLHAALCREPRIEPYVLPVDFDGTKAATQTNIDTKRRAVEFLRANGAIVIFPAGAISTSNGLFGRVSDVEWKLFATKLIQMTQATVVPIYFHGQNSRMFQMVSQFSETLRLSMIVHEVNKKRGQTLKVTIGDPISYGEIAHIKKRRELLIHLRTRIYELGGMPELASLEGTVSEQY